MARSGSRQGPLTGDQKRLICQLLAEYCPPAEVVARFKEATGRQIRLSHVCYYRDSPKWAAEVDKAREALLANLGKLPIASKFWRLQELQGLYQDALKARRIRTVRKATKLEDGKLVPVYERLEERDFGAPRELLRQAAEELGQLRHHEPPPDPDRPRQVLLGGELVPSSIAGIPEAGPILDGPG